MTLVVVAVQHDAPDVAVGAWLGCSVRPGGDLGPSPHTPGRGVAR